MFYSQFILAKKGPLATIWIAAHLERKLRKNQITDTNIGESVDSILYPEVPIALRLSGHLMLGVVRIYSRKVNLLLNDCSDALVKIHQVFQSSAVNLPPGAIVAPFNSITLPESFDFDDLEAHLSRENVAARVGNRSDFEHHVTARDLITLQDQNDDRRLLFTLDERFEDAGNPYAVLDFSSQEFAPTLQKPISPSAHQSYAENITLEDDVLPPLPMEDDMDFEGMNVDKSPRNAMEGEPQIETTVEGPSPFPKVIIVEVPDIEKVRAVNEAGQQEHVMGFEEPSVSMDVDDKFPSIKKGVDVESTHVLEETPLLREEPTPLRPKRSSLPKRSSPPRSPMAFSEDHDILGSILGKRTPKLDVMPTPVSVKRSSKKRKHDFDDIVSLPSVEMKKQLKSTNDICRARRKAPSTEYEIWMSKRDNHIEQKFAEPSFPGLGYDLRSIYDGVISKKFVSLRKQQMVEQASTRRTPRGVGRLDPDGKEGVDDMRIIVDPEPFAEEPQNETVVTSVPLAASEDLNTKADDVDVAAGQPSPDHEISFFPVLAMDEGGAVDITREQDEGVSTVEHLEETTVRDIGEDENEAAVNEDVTPKTKTQGLAFLADSRDTDEPANEIAANKRSGKSSNDSGWSSRSRAVVLYLKEKFEAMDSGKVKDLNQNRSLNLETLLTGRTRKEAARLFFETLVLGTKGYLQVEQASSYADIQLLASRRLLKAVF